MIWLYCNTILIPVTLYSWILVSDEGGKKFAIRDHSVEGDIQITVKLPANLRCKHCVFRWRYRTGTVTIINCIQTIGRTLKFYICAYNPATYVHFRWLQMFIIINITILFKECFHIKTHVQCGILYYYLQ